MTSQRIATDALQGAVAGAAATWLMDRVTTWMYTHERAETKAREDEMRGGRTAYETAADRAADVAGIALTPTQRGRGATALHWATGVSAAAVYGVLRKHWPATATAKGLAFGAGVFLLLDELLNPVLRLTPGPQAFPWETTPAASVVTWRSGRPRSSSWRGSTVSPDPGTQPRRRPARRQTTRARAPEYAARNTAPSTRP
jgi:hypothetical protein